MSKDKKTFWKFWYALNNNGWSTCGNKYDLEQAKMRILSGQYHCVVQVNVAMGKRNLCVNGHYGIVWIEVLEYECDAPYSRCDLNDMLFAIELAEDNLLALGIPFEPDYRFGGNNRANKKRRNDALRRKWHLDELEEYAENEKAN